MGGRVRLAEPQGMDVLCSLYRWERRRDDLLSPQPHLRHQLTKGYYTIFVYYIYIIFIREKVQLGYGMEELIQMVVVPNAPNSV